MEALAKVGNIAGCAAFLAGGLFAAFSGGHSWALYSAGGLALTGVVLVTASCAYDFFAIFKDANQEETDTIWMLDIPDADTSDTESTDEDDYDADSDEEGMQASRGV